MKRQNQMEPQQPTEPRCQTTTDLGLSCRGSNELQKGGWPRQGCVLPTIQQALWDAVYWDTHREVYREVDRQVYQVHQDSIKAAYQERIYQSTG